MPRIIKRYGSRKLYDTEDSRYVSLDEVAARIRAGEHISVLDNETSEDVTSQTLTQVILEEGRRGATFSPAFLHDLIRRGEQVVTSGVETLQSGVDRLIQASVDRVPPLRALRDETLELRKRLEALEAQITDIESAPAGRGAASRQGARASAPDHEPSRPAGRAVRRKGATS